MGKNEAIELELVNKGENDTGLGQRDVCLGGGNCAQLDKPRKGQLHKLV